MKTRLIRIGNSKGVRIPKALIEQSGLRDEVELVLKGNSLLIRPASKPREGWAEAFAEMSQREDDVLIDETIATEFDRTEWQW
ncbi:MAG TPA: AbrB/MazE/SpoVT family DNA-binding domain-containing protein [Pirellulales bacterium]|jgi:antitoxin MazE|nr:AbrB/MazE/SpoVT family DNA-binding domain-containing protein [Pirellulales bacterium]